MVIVANPVYAQFNNITVNGYASLVVGQQTEKQQYLGYDDKFSGSCQDTSIGIQMRLRYHDRR